jgi:ATP-dependent protease HslVU (ClpYQ) peptidase subunit
MLLVCGYTKVIYKLIGPVFHPVNDYKFWAIGSGRDFALAAMEMGATAEEAVLLASKFDRKTGNVVSTAVFTEWTDD